MIEILFKASLAIFIAGNLLDMGLRLNHKHAIGRLRDSRFVVHTLFWGFGVGPLLAYAITLIIPLEEPYAIGLVLLGMTPGVPFLPMVINRVKGDLGYTAAFMLLVAMGAIFFMPLVVPLLLTGLTVSSWTIAKPLLTIMFIPLATGMIIHRYSEALAYKIFLVVKKITLVFTVAACVLGALVYGKGATGLDLRWAILAVVIFFFIVTTFPYWFGVGLIHEQKIIISLGMSTRNLGAALAPLLSVPLIDERAIIMIGLGLPAMLLSAWLATKWFGKTNH